MLPPACPLGRQKTEEYIELGLTVGCKGVQSFCEQFGIPAMSKAPNLRYKEASR